MNLILIKLLLSQLIPLITGYGIVAFLLKRVRLPRFVNLSLSYLLGLGVVALWMLVLSIGHRPWSVLKISGFCLGTALAFLCLRYRSAGKKNSLPPISLNSTNGSSLNSEFSLFRLFIHGVLLCVIIYNIFYIFIVAMNLPVNSWDAIATIAFKAKIFYYAKTLPPLNTLPYPYYPLLIPFNETWIALCLGTWSDILIKIMFPLSCLSFIFFFYYFLKTSLNKTWALAGCCLLLSSNLLLFHTTTAYRDLHLMIYNCTAIMLLILWQKNPEYGYLWLASLFGGIATFTKLEGTVYLLIHTLIFLWINFLWNPVSLKKKWIHLAVFMLPSYGICAGYHIFKILQHAARGAVADKTRLDFDWDKIAVLPEILYNFLESLFYSGNWCIVWLVFIVACCLLCGQQSNRSKQLLLLSIALFFGLYLFIAFFTANTVWFIGGLKYTLISRLILHIFPLSVAFLIFFLAQAEKQK